jgi:transcription initiation factor IIE alpha subunit
MSVGVALALYTYMTIAFDPHALAAHVLRAIARPRRRVVTVDEVARTVGARREDVRRIVSRLHQEGFVDALRMRPTMAGLAVATSLRSCKLKDVRSESKLPVAPEAACA